MLVGLDIEAKAAWVRAQVTAALEASPGGPPGVVEWTLARTDHEDADTEEAASCRAPRCVRDADAAKVGRAFTAPLVELALASYPGFTLTAPPAHATPYGVYRAAYVAALGGARAGGARRRHGAGRGRPGVTSRPRAGPERRRAALRATRADERRTARPPGCRWAPSRTPAAATRAATPTWGSGPATVARTGAWLADYLTADRVRELLPEAAGLDVTVHPLPNLRAVNVVLPRAAGRGGRGLGPVRPAGQGGRRVAAVAGTSTSRRTCCEHS